MGIGDAQFVETVDRKQKAAVDSGAAKDKYKQGDAGADGEAGTKPSGKESKASKRM